MDAMTTTIILFGILFTTLIVGLAADTNSR